jgi:hypothetical protein
MLRLHTNCSLKNSFLQIHFSSVNHFTMLRVTLQLTVSQSVCLGVEPRLGLMTRYILLVKVTVLSIWGALSDERSCLLRCCQYLYYIETNGRSLSQQ